MAFSKAHRFRPGDYYYSLICRALAHPARLTILRKLNDEGICTPETLLKGMPISRAALSQHLKILREMHLVECRQEFPTVHYWLNEKLPDTYAAIITLLLYAEAHEVEADMGELTSISGPLRPEPNGV